MKSKYSDLFDPCFFAAAQDVEDAVNTLVKQDTGGINADITTAIEKVQSEWDYFTKHYLGRE